MTARLRKRPRLTVLIIALVLVTPGATAAAATRATLRSPATASLSGHLTVRASGLIRGRYALYIGVTTSHPKGGQAIVCSGQVGNAREVSGRASFSGRLPKFLGCRSGGGPLLGSIPTKPGHYTLVLGVPIGRGEFGGDSSFIQRPITVTP